MMMMMMMMLMMLMMLYNQIYNNDNDDGLQKTDCLEKGIKYLGFKLLKPGTTRNLWATYGEMPDPAQCQALCAKTEGCGWFNHSTTGCFLKTAQGTGTREADGATSGPPKCS